MRTAASVVLTSGSEVAVASKVTPMKLDLRPVCSATAAAVDVSTSAQMRMVRVRSTKPHTSEGNGVRSSSFGATSPTSGVSVSGTATGTHVSFLSYSRSIHTIPT